MEISVLMLKISIKQFGKNSFILLKKKVTLIYKINIIMSDSLTSCEKLVKYTLKSVSKKYGIDYEELKSVLKKVVKTARNYDESILGMMEEIMDIGNVGSVEELEDFSIEVLMVYCKIKEIDTENISERHIRSRVWKNIESEFELDEEDSEEESDSEEEESESEEEIEEEKHSRKHREHKKKSSTDLAKSVEQIVVE
jgi:hypothetical protein